MKIEIDCDLETIFLCAIRYAMGRRTYMPSLVCDYLRPLLPNLSDYFLKLALQEYEFRDKMYEGDYGDTCDYQTWIGFKREVEREVEARRLRMHSL